MADRRYGSTRWKRLRLAVLARDGYECRVRGPTCRFVANSVNHRIPASEAPELFFSPENLEACCTACNSSGGAYLTNTRRRELVEENQYLQGLVQVQQAQIDELLETVARHESNAATASARPRPQPAIR